MLRGLPLVGGFFRLGGALLPLLLRAERFLILGMKCEKLGAALPRHPDRLLKTVAVDLRMVAREKNLGHLFAAEDARLRILRIFENTRGDGFSLMTLTAG